MQTMKKTLKIKKNYKLLNNPKEHKRVVIIEGSPRKGGNTDLLADEFARGAKEAGGSVYKYFLDDFDLKFFGEGDQQRMGQSPMGEHCRLSTEGFRGLLKCAPTQQSVEL